MNLAALLARSVVHPSLPRRLTALVGVAALVTLTAACTGGSNATPQAATPEAVSNMVEPTPAEPNMSAPSPVANSNDGGSQMNFASPADVGQMAAFLTGPVMYTDASTNADQKTFPPTVGKQLAVSYYSTPNYWGGYVCAQPNTDCAYTIKADWDAGHQWPDPMTGNPAANLAFERADASAGADIYDIATWQIALALAAKDAAATGVDAGKLQDLIKTQNLHLTDPKSRATAKEFTYGYVDQISDPQQAFFFRMNPMQFMVTDPLWTDPKYKSLITNDPSVKDQKQLGQTSWSDWKPITGENAWAWFLGPIHADELKNAAQGYIPYNSTSIKNALAVLDAFSKMQTGIGAFYYATGGSLGNTGEPITPGEISVENNFSALGGLRVLEAALQATKDKDPGADKAAIDAALAKINVMLNGGTTVAGYHTDGLLSFMFNGAYSPDKGFFTQGGHTTPRENPGGWVAASDSDPWAVDVNTWGLAALGPATADAWWGPGSAYKIWQNVRQWGGYFGPAKDKSQPIWGVGYSNQDSNGIMSTEWTSGAINMLHMLVTYYTANPGGISEQQLASLKADEQSMLTNIQKLRTDNYPSAGFNDAVPAEFMANPPAGQQAYLYGSKRYFIPFGWFANPLPSTTSTSWPVMLHYNFNPFQPGGSYSAAALPKPAAKDISGGGGAATPTPGPSGPLPALLQLKVINNVTDAKIGVNHRMSPGGPDVYGKQIDVGQSADVTLPAGTAIVLIGYSVKGGPWGLACQVSNPSSLIATKTLTAVWRDPRGGNMECVQ